MENLWESRSYSCEDVGHVCHVKKIRDVRMDLIQKSCRDNLANKDTLKLCSGVWILS